MSRAVANICSVPSEMSVWPEPLGKLPDLNHKKRKGRSSPVPLLSHTGRGSWHQTRGCCGSTYHLPVSVLLLDVSSCFEQTTRHIHDSKASHLYLLIVSYFRDVLDNIYKLWRGVDDGSCCAQRTGGFRMLTRRYWRLALCSGRGFIQSQFRDFRSCDSADNLHTALQFSF